MGTGTSFGVFFKELAFEFSLSRATTSAIFSVRMVLGSVSAVFIGWALDRFGPKIIVLIMGGLTGLSLILTGQTTATWQVFSTFGVLLAMGSGAAYTAVMSTVSHWFNRQRGLAIGIVGSGAGLGTVFFAPFAAYLITDYNWRVAYIVIAVIVIVFIMPLSLVLKRDPGEIGILPDGVKPEPSDMELFNQASIQEIPQSHSLSMPNIFRTRSFWIIGLLWLSTAFIMFLLLTHIVPHITDIGFSPMQAATFLSLNGIANMSGMIIMGSVSDRIGKKIIAVICSLIPISFILWLVWADELWILFLIAVAIGFGEGGQGAVVTALIGDTFGVANIGKLMGMLALGWAIGAGLGPVIGGLIFDKVGNYSPAFMIVMVVMLMRTLFIILIRQEVNVSEPN